jgi:ATP-dependent DNA helicase PIF1
MTKRPSVEMLDRSLQDIMGCELPFGGKVMVFRGVQAGAALCATRY